MSRLAVAAVAASLLVVVSSAAVAVAQAEAAETGQPQFSDVAGGTHQAAIEALAPAGTFAGSECSAGRFCGDEPIKRWVMAVWLVRVVDGADPAPAENSAFADVEAAVWWSPFVERLRVLGVTKGCGANPLRFCPDKDVTRAQMASFLVRAFYIQDAPVGVFRDVAGNTHRDSINTLAAARITAGCATGPARYCPAAAVTRAQMATFLARAAELITLPEVPEVTDPEAPEVTDYEAVADYEPVSAGGSHSCGLRTNGTVSCWGNNSDGQAAAPDGTFAAVSAGGWHSCGLRTNGTVSCWGDNSYGQAATPGSDTFAAVSAGGWHSCGLLASGTVSCWGNNSDGQAAAPDGTFAAVSAGQWHSCGLRTNGTVSCWGDNSEGQAAAPGSDTFEAVSAGQWHSCGLRTDGTVSCWGDNDDGQAAAPGFTFAAVSAGGSHSCGLRTNGTVSCWGDNSYGRAAAPGGTFAA